MSSSKNRDLVQISLGPSANAVTAHVLNLQGLAVTDDEGACDASTTHRIERDHLVPRCLMVDEPTRFFVSPEISQTMQMSQTSDASSMLQALASSFQVQPLHSDLHLQHVQHSEWSQHYQSLSSQLAYSTFSRYYQKPTAHVPSYKASSENARHVNWDDLDEQGEEEEENDDDMQKQARWQRERLKWQRETLEPLQERLHQVIDESKDFQSSPLSWMDYWMPPFSEQSKVALEFSHLSQISPYWDAYQTNSNVINDWMEDVLLDRVRQLLEESDSCQGFMITTEGHGLYAGLASTLLQELQQETKSASRAVFHVNNPKQESSDNQSDKNETESESWQPANVQRVRKNISSGLALHDLTQDAHIVVPLALPSGEESLFRASAQVAMAIEACTLPIRLNSSPPRRIGLTNAPFFGQGGDYDAQWGSTAQCLSMSEYIQCLQPSSQYKLLEMDTLSSGRKVDNEQLWRYLLPGTSLERDARTRDDGHSLSRPRDVGPGVWMQDQKSGGLLSSLSPQPSNNPQFGDRSLHHHFALGTTVRPVLLHDSFSDPRHQYDPTAKTIPHFQTAIIQGMGIAYRPERSMATVMNQTLGQLTFGSPTSGGAGAYWKSFLETVDQPTMALLGNSTRVYSHVQQISNEMKLVLGPRYRGFHQRDILNGILPEAEDCQEALEGCYNLRDIYQPPDGSGLALDESEGDIDY